METLIEAIRVALRPDATDEAKHQGALACRTILTALETKEGDPLAAPKEAPTAPKPPAVAPPAMRPEQVAAFVAGLRGLPPEQLLERAITALRAAMPAGAAVPSVAPLRFHIVQLGPLTDAKGGS